jgi:hypothetical protein
VWECCEHLPSDVALETANRLLLGPPFLHTALDVVPGSRVLDHSSEHDVPQGRVGLAIPASIEPVPLLLPARGVDGRDPTELGERRFVLQALGVVADLGPIPWIDDRQ